MTSYTADDTLAETMEETTMTRLDVFQAYDYYFRLGAIKDLTTNEQAFYDHCSSNHHTICNEDTSDNNIIITKASKLYDLI